MITISSYQKTDISWTLKSEHWLYEARLPQPVRHAALNQWYRVLKSNVVAPLMDITQLIPWWTHDYTS